MRHTKGPWNAIKRMPSQVKIEHSGFGLRSVIATMRDDELCPEHGGNYEANACLIAAAPDMLEALKRVEKQLFERDSRAPSYISAAILAAESEVGK